MGKNLTQRAIDAARNSGKRTILRDAAAPGLKLTISTRGARWSYEYKTKFPDGTWSPGRSLPLGLYPETGIDEARQAAWRVKADVADGKDPAIERQARIEENRAAQSGQTVAEALDELTLLKSHQWSRHTQANYASTHGYIRRAIGDLPMRLVTRKQLQKAISDYLTETRAAGMDGRARAMSISLRLSTLWKEARDWDGDWLDDASIAQGLKVPGSEEVIERSRVLTTTEIRRLWSALESGVGAGVGQGPRRILKLALMTGLRVGAIASLRVDDVDLDPVQIVGARDTGPTITIRAADGNKVRHRDRVSGNHTVLPLSPQAVAILRAQMDETDGPHLFPGYKDKSMSQNTVSQAWARLREAGAAPEDSVAHDLRRTFRTMLGDIDHPGSEEDEERLILHVVGSRVKRTYDRSRRLARLRPIADAIGAHIERIVTASSEVRPMEGVRDAI